MSAILCRSVPDRATHTTSSNPAGVSSPQESCSPITLEYAEELLLMAYDGRCGVMDVSQVAKECPSGIVQLRSRSGEGQVRVRKVRFRSCHVNLKT